MTFLKQSTETACDHFVEMNLFVIYGIMFLIKNSKLSFNVEDHLYKEVDVDFPLYCIFSSFQSEIQEQTKIIEEENVDCLSQSSCNWFKLKIN